MTGQIAGPSTFSLELVGFVIGVSMIVGAIDLIRQPGWAWKRAEESKAAYLVLVLLLPLVGLGIYLYVARPKVAPITAGGRAASLPFEQFGTEADQKQRADGGTARTSAPQAGFGSFGAIPAGDGHGPGLQTVPAGRPGRGLQTGPLGMAPVGMAPAGTGPGLQTGLLGMAPAGTAPLGTGPFGTGPFGTEPLGMAPDPTGPGHETELTETEAGPEMGPDDRPAPVHEVSATFFSTGGVGTRTARLPVGLARTYRPRQRTSLTESAEAGPTVPAGWKADPTGRHQFRYWDGFQWTESVADAGEQTRDPVSP